VGNVLINEATLSSIADAIREKNGSTETYKPAEMPQAILSIESGSVDEIETLHRYFNHQLTDEDVAQILQKEIEKSGTNSPFISSYAFAGQIRIKDIVVPEGIRSIESRAFESSSLEKISLPEGLVSIHDYAFMYSKVLELTIPSTVKKIGVKALEIGYHETVNGDGVSHFANVYFKGTPTNLDDSAFGHIANQWIDNIYVPWSEGEVAGAPWGADYATIHYNYTE
jgi:hypothetical protein